MTGLLYKEFRQFWYILLIAALAPAVFIWLPLLLFVIGDKPFEQQFRDYCSFQITPIMMICVFLIVGMLENSYFTDDEKKKWCFFTLSHPKGSSEQLHMKYGFVLLTSALLSVSAIFQWSLLDLLSFRMLGEESAQSVDSVLIIGLFFLQILLRATDIPFYLRYGVQRGSMIKCLVILALLYLGFIYFLFGPLPDAFEPDLTAIQQWLSGNISSEKAETVLLLINLFPFAAMVLYYLSYKLSCRLYRKGAQEYE